MSPTEPGSVPGAGHPQVKVAEGAPEDRVREVPGDCPGSPEGCGSR